MDPVSVIGLAGSLVGISELITKSLRRLIELQSRYRSASLTASLLIGQLTTIKAALTQITEMVSSSLVSIPGHEQLVMDLEVSLESCKILVTLLEDRISQLEHDDHSNLKIRGKAGFLWEEAELSMFTNHLNNQVNALNLFLTALHCRTAFERNALLQDNESREILKRVEDNKASLLSLRDSASDHTKRSKATDDSTLLDREFDFDNEVITTSVYRAALRSNLSKSNSKNVLPWPLSDEHPIQECSKSTSEPVRDFGLIENEKAHFEPNLLSEQPTAHYPQQLSRFQSWFQAGGAIVETTEIDRFSSRLSRVSSLLRRGDNSSVYSFGSQAESDDVEPDEPVVSAFVPSQGSQDTEHDPLMRMKTTKNSFRVSKIFKIHRPNETPNPEMNIMRKNARFKVLLLGSGSSGKTTLFKALDSLSKGGLTLKDRLQFKEVVLTNTVQSMRDILEAMVTLGIPLEDGVNEYHVKTVLTLLPSDDTFPPKLGTAIETLWKDEGVKSAFEKSNEYCLQDTAAYFLNSVARISGHEYIPTEEDVFMARVRSTGSYKTTHSFGDITFDLVDTGGERSERKKWMHNFPNVAQIIFVVDISAYDKMLYEQNTANRMEDSLQLFDAICKSPWFVKTQIILLFTKMDLFEEKIQKHPIGKYFPDFTGDENNLDGIISFIESRFLSKNLDKSRNIKTIFASFSGEHNSATRLVLDEIISNLRLYRRGP